MNNKYAITKSYYTKIDMSKSCPDRGGDCFKIYKCDL